MKRLCQWLLAKMFGEPCGCPRCGRFTRSKYIDYENAEGPPCPYCSRKETL